MDTGQIFLVLLAILAANLPFFSDRIFFAVPIQEEKKHLGWLLLELGVFYFLVGGAAYLLEGRLGQPHRQDWEFYAITACLFLVFAFPGFVAKYLWGARGR